MSYPQSSSLYPHLLSLASTLKENPVTAEPGSTIPSFPGSVAPMAYPPHGNMAYYVPESDNSHPELYDYYPGVGVGVGSGLGTGVSHVGVDVSPPLAHPVCLPWSENKDTHHPCVPTMQIPSHDAQPLDLRAISATPSPSLSSSASSGGRFGALDASPNPFHPLQLQQQQQQRLFETGYSAAAEWDYGQNMQHAHHYPFSTKSNAIYAPSSPVTTFAAGYQVNHSHGHRQFNAVQKTSAYYSPPHTQLQTQLQTQQSQPQPLVIEEYRREREFLTTEDQVR
jgi:hypothetical protein